MRVSSCGLFAAVSFALASACDSSTGNKEPRVVLTPSATTASVGQGTTTNITIDVQRSNYEGTVTFTVQGAPEGVNVAVTPSGLTTSATSTKLIIAATGIANPGNAVLTV